MVVQIAGQPAEPPLRATSVLGIALLSEDARRDVNEEAASGIENASAPRALTNNREARLANMLTEYGRTKEETLNVRVLKPVEMMLIVDRSGVFRGPLYTNPICCGYTSKNS